MLTDEKTHEKYALNDFVLIPKYAVLDPVLTRGLPPFITATTGMDALTHAVEAYIGKSNTAQTIEDSVTAVKLIFKNLERAYREGTDMEARENMQKASFLQVPHYKAYVGYVHAIAHSLGGEYNVPHGLANAVILPMVLKAYGETIHKKLSRLAVAAGLADKDTPYRRSSLSVVISATSRYEKEIGIGDIFRKSGKPMFRSWRIMPTRRPIPSIRFRY